MADYALQQRWLLPKPCTTKHFKKINENIKDTVFELQVLNNFLFSFRFALFILGLFNIRRPNTTTRLTLLADSCGSAGTTDEGFFHELELHYNPTASGVDNRISACR